MYKIREKYWLPPLVEQYYKINSKKISEIYILHDNSNLNGSCMNTNRPVQLILFSIPSLLLFVTRQEQI